MFTGESSAINMQLPLGNKDFNYTLDIHVYVFDKYGDYNSTTAQVKASNSFTCEEIMWNHSNSCGPILVDFFFG